MLEKTYKEKLDIMQTQEACAKLKHHFEKELLSRLTLTKFSSPLFIDPTTGLQDKLNGVEKPVSFEASGKTLEVVHSLAKWKRLSLKKYEFKPGTGICTDMLAIRKDETPDALHSYLVDQWDWERIITKEERSLDTLRSVVCSIYKAIRSTSRYIKKEYPVLTYKLPKSLHFITTQELEDLYPEKTPDEREYLITKKYGAVFLIGIGDKLKSGEKHDSRSPDYDDWTLDGDLLLWHKDLETHIEITSMGIRVDEGALLSQLKKSDTMDRLPQMYHQMIIKEELPYTIGGGIGQSRLSMLLLEKMHIGEVSHSDWSKEEIERCKEKNIKLL